MRQKTARATISTLHHARRAATIRLMTLKSAEAFRTRGPETMGPAPAAPSHPRPGEPECGVGQGDLGTSAGVNISPGSDDDGWTVPQPVRLADGTRIQLYKDGEALHAAYE